MQGKILYLSVPISFFILDLTGKLGENSNNFFSTKINLTVYEGAIPIISFLIETLIIDLRKQIFEQKQKNQKILSQNLPTAIFEGRRWCQMKKN